jgi:hypothetical protein
MTKASWLKWIADITVLNRIDTAALNTDELRKLKREVLQSISDYDKDGIKKDVNNALSDVGLHPDMPHKNIVKLNKHDAESPIF